MATISRTYTFSDGTNAYGSQVETEISTIVTAWNNHDAGTSLWTVMNATAIKKQSFTTLQVLQVVNDTDVTDFTTTSSTFQTTNCSAAITPKSTSSGILILAQGILRNNDADTSSVGATIFRDSTNLGGGSAEKLQEFRSVPTLNGNVLVPCCMVYYDSPSSTSAITYSVKINSSDNTTTVGFGNNSKTAITLIEFL